MKNIINHTELPPELSALEASLASLTPQVSPGSVDRAKTAALLRLLARQQEPPPISGTQLIETIVKTDDQEITLSLREYVKSARFGAALSGLAIGSAAGVFLGLLLGIAGMALLQTPQIREVHHIPYFVNDQSRNL